MFAAWARCAYGPFDMLRNSFAAAVKAGWVRKSVLASSRFERALAALELVALGPLARRR